MAKAGPKFCYLHTHTDQPQRCHPKPLSLCNGSTPKKLEKLANTTLLTGCNKKLTMFQEYKKQ